VRRPDDRILFEGERKVHDVDRRRAAGDEARDVRVPQEYMAVRGVAEVQLGFSVI
jgi:hypothetical protein